MMGLKLPGSAEAIIQSDKKYFYGFLVLAYLVVANSTMANAQKLPKVQEVSMRAPTRVIIDGRENEWGKFQAYNTSNQIYYTMANDDDNLYLIIKTANIRMVQKTMAAGIIFTAYPTKNKKDKQHVDITFPSMVRGEYQRILRIGLKDYGREYTETNPIKDTALKARHLDTLTKLTNNQIITYMKMIGVKGIPSIQDTVISLYNEADIRFNARFDRTMMLTYELAIPLKYLGVSPAKPGPFAYHITLTGVDHQYVYTGPRTTTYINGEFVQSEPTINHDIISTNDFWGEYTLAKKQ